MHVRGPIVMIGFGPGRASSRTLRSYLSTLVVPDSDRTDGGNRSRIATESGVGKQAISLFCCCYEK
jgi:hypothetical protein